MRTVTMRIVGVSPYSASRQHAIPANSGEAPDDYEQRTWRHRLHIGPDGRAFIPGIAFKRSIEKASQYSGDKIKGRGMKRWSEKFRSGILCTGDCVIEPAVTLENVKGIALQVDPQGGRQASGSKRVQRTFPIVAEWECTATFLILDDEITEEVFEKYAKLAGVIDGMGRFRPGVGGTNGRYRIDGFKWSQTE